MYYCNRFFQVLSSLALILKQHVNEIPWGKERAQKTASDLFLMLFLNKSLENCGICITSEITLLNCQNVVSMISIDV